MDELNSKIEKSFIEISPEKRQKDLQFLAADLRLNLRRLIVEDIQIANRLLTLITFLLRNYHDNDIISEIQAQYQKDVTKLEKDEIKYIKSLIPEFKKFDLELEFNSE